MKINYYNAESDEVIERPRVKLDPDKIVDDAPPHRKIAETLLYLAHQYDRAADTLRDPSLRYPDKELVIDTLRYRSEEFRDLVDMHIADYTEKALQDIIKKYAKSLDQVTRLIADWQIRNLPNK